MFDPKQLTSTDNFFECSLNHTLADKIVKMAKWGFICNRKVLYVYVQQHAAYCQKVTKVSPAKHLQKGGWTFNHNNHDDDDELLEAAASKEVLEIGWGCAHSSKNSVIVLQSPRVVAQQTPTLGNL